MSFSYRQAQKLVLDLFNASHLAQMEDVSIRVPDTAIYWAQTLRVDGMGQVEVWVSSCIDGGPSKLKMALFFKNYGGEVDPDRLLEFATGAKRLMDDLHRNLDDVEFYFDERDTQALQRVYG